MTITRRQRNIINPFADSLLEANNIEYSYDDLRNSWVIQGIHDIYLNFGELPAIGSTLIAGSGLAENTELSVQDAEAYAALYPQNAKVVIDVDLFSLEECTPLESEEQLAAIAQTLITDNGSVVYSTSTTEEAQRPENQGAISEISGSSTPSDQQILLQSSAQLPSINYNQSIETLSELRKTFQYPSNTILDAPLQTEVDSVNSSLLLQSDGVDLYDWQNNALAGNQSEVKYYNSLEQMYYFVKRTNSTEPEGYDNYTENQSTIDRVSQAKNYGLTKILGIAGKLSDENLDLILNPQEGSSPLEFRSFLSIRPGSRWVYAVRLGKEIIDELEGAGIDASLADEQYSPYQKSKILFSLFSEGPFRYSSFTISSIESKIEKLLYVLRQYRSLMLIENITSDMIGGFNISSEIQSLQTLQERLQAFFTYNNIEITSPEKDYIEFVFSPNMTLSHVFFNGSLYTQAIGKTVFTKPKLGSDAPTPASSDSYTNVFNGVSPYLWGFLYKSFDIENQTKDKIIADWPTWSDFLNRYTIPSVNINPSKISEERKKKSSKIAPPPNIFSLIDKVARPTSTQATEIFNKREFYSNIVSAGASCGTAQAQIFNDILMFANLVNGKASLKSIIRTAVLRYKDEILQSKVVQNRLKNENNESYSEIVNVGINRGIRYLDNPSATDQALRDAEEFVNRELACLVDVIGEFIEDSVLKPNGNPPLISRALRSPAARPALSFKFRKTPSRNMWKIWLNLLDRLLTQFVKQLMYGILRDTLKASLGCGPDQPNNPAAGLKSALKALDYGMSDLNQYTEGIDLIELAQKFGLSNKDIEVVDDKETITMSPPRIEQLEQLHSDVSNIVTPDELKVLLEGDASDELLSLINEMINSGEIDTEGFDGDTTAAIERFQQYGGYYTAWTGLSVVAGAVAAATITPLEKTPLLMAQRQESLLPGDERYAVLGFSNSVLREYFQALGDEIGQAKLDLLDRPAEGDESTGPEDAYCEDISPFSVDAILTREQLENQYDDIIEAKMKQIDSLCNLGDLPSLQFQMDSFINGLPSAGWYDSILAFIARISNELADLLAKSLFGDDETETWSPRAQTFYDTKFGKAISATLGNHLQNRMNSFTQYPFIDDIFETRSETLVTQIEAQRLYSDNILPPRFRDLPNTRINIEWGPRTPSVNFDIPPEGSETVRIYFAASPNRIGDLITEAPIAADENVEENLRLRGLRLSNGNPGALAQVDGIQGIPSFLSDGVNFAVGHYTRGQFRGRQPYHKVAYTQNTIPTLISNFYYSEIGRSRLPLFLKDLLAPVFISDSDNCATTRDESIALAALNGIQSRVITFFMNVGPLMTTFLGWSAPTTINIITTYLSNKIIQELKEKAIYGPYLQSMEKVKLVYHSEDQEENKLFLPENLNNEDILRAVVRQFIEKLILKIGSRGVFRVDQNPLESSLNEDGDEQIQWTWYTQMIEALRVELLALPSLSENERANLENNDRTWLQLALYYLPIPILYGGYIIHFDASIDLVGKYPKFTLESTRRSAYADDRLLGSLNDNYVPAFSTVFANLPYTYIPADGQDRTEFWTPAQIEKRILELEENIILQSERALTVSEFTEEDAQELEGLADDMRDIITNSIANLPDANDPRVLEYENVFGNRSIFRTYYSPPDNNRIDFLVGRELMSVLVPENQEVFLSGEVEDVGSGRLRGNDRRERVLVIWEALQANRRARFGQALRREGASDGRTRSQTLARNGALVWLREYQNNLPYEQVQANYLREATLVENRDTGLAALRTIRETIKSNTVELNSLRYILGGKDE